MAFEKYARTGKRHMTEPVLTVMEGRGLRPNIVLSDALELVLGKSDVVLFVDSNQGRIGIVKAEGWSDYNIHVATNGLIADAKLAKRIASRSILMHYDKDEGFWVGDCEFVRG